MFLHIYEWCTSVPVIYTVASPGEAASGYSLYKPLALPAVHVWKVWGEGSWLKHILVWDWVLASYTYRLCGEPVVLFWVCWLSEKQGVGGGIVVVDSPDVLFWSWALSPRSLCCWVSVERSWEHGALCWSVNEAWSQLTFQVPRATYGHPFHKLHSWSWRP